MSINPGITTMSDGMKSGRILTLLLLPLLALAASCASVGQGGLQGELNQARSNWRVTSPASYVYRYQLSCFCPRELVQPVLITVRNARIDSVVYADTHQPVDPQHLRNFHTIDELFDMLQEAISRDPYEMAASYDPSFGYPTSATIDYDEKMADEEMRFVADSLRLLED